MTIKNLLIIVFVCLFTTSMYGQIVKAKIIDDGGSGPYRAIAVTEKSLPDFVV